MKAWVQQWTESERGWGQRPDGFTVHRTRADLLQYIADYWARMPDEAPDEYSRPDGKPFEYEIDTTALQQRMLVLGYTPSIGGVYGASEDAVVQSYADQLGVDPEDRFDLNAVIAQVLPVMDADIEAGAAWVGKSKGTLTTIRSARRGRL